MNEVVDLTVILPAYNEVKVIPRTLAEVQAYLDQRGLNYEIIVSADGTDGTRELVAEMAKSNFRLHVIGNSERKGKGYGVRSAVFLAKGNIIGFMDADNKTSITELDKILPWFEKGYDIVIGSRGLKATQIVRRQPLYRRLGAIGFRFFMWGITGLWNIRDTQCGFKFFKRNVIMDLFERQRIDGYMFDVEILYLAKQAHYRLMQVGIVWRDDADSRLVLIGGNIRNFLDVIKIRFT